MKAKRIGMVVLFGCGLVSGVAGARPLAVAQPLIRFDTPPAAPLARQQAASPHDALQRLAPSGRFDTTLMGKRGEGLNLAASLHRRLLALGVPAEVWCSELTPDRVRQGRMRLHIKLPRALSPSQRGPVLRMLSTLPR